MRQIPPIKNRVSKPSAMIQNAMYGDLAPTQELVNCFLSNVALIGIAAICLRKGSRQRCKLTSARRYSPTVIDASRKLICILIGGRI